MQSINFISKADTLAKLSKVLKKSHIEQFYVFTEHNWLENRELIVNSINNQFCGKTIIVRSSALNEDTLCKSNAGAYKSVLNVPGTDVLAISNAIDEVILSYMEKGVNDPNNQILVQLQTLDVVFSGTILTRDYNSAPYYVINYSNKNTTAVTSGEKSDTIKSLKNGKSKLPKIFTSLIVSVQEIERLFSLNTALDIEFGINRMGEIVIFQVRPLVASFKSPFSDEAIFNKVEELKLLFMKLSKRRANLSGDITYFGDMPDWNPAEIVGNSPRPLAASLYGEIITDEVWHRARKSQGYIDVNPAKLVTQFGNKPYVDIRNSFNSFVPAGLSLNLREKLLVFYLAKLKENPHLQDKVEFNILFTCYDLSFDSRVNELLSNGFSINEVDQLKNALLTLTNSLLNLRHISSDIKDNIDLENYRQGLPSLGVGSRPRDYIERAICLLAACKEKGTLQFSRLARLGFIGKILLKSLEQENVIDSDFSYNLLATICSVASDFTNDLDLFKQGLEDREYFVNKYGHLRPGTYDITSLRYDMSDEDFSLSDTKKYISSNFKKPEFNISVQQYRKNDKV